MLFRLSAAIVLIAAIPARVSAQVEPNWNGGVDYSYDGAGNIYRMGTDTFKYDAAGRLVESKTNGIQRNYAYDRYGNRTECTHAQGTPSESDCQYGYTIDAAKNRIAGVTYDDAGNLHKVGTHTYTYDALNALTRDAVGATSREYVYDANGERVAVYEVNASKWRWTFRDPSGKVLREFTSTGNGTANWKWVKDYVWRDGLLLATRQIEPGKTTPVTYHYHLDHLGTPRRITNDTDQIVGTHSYHAFGPETSGGRNEPALSVMKFTGHERDTSGVDSWDTLDYMHARYYNGTLGRFLSVDPGRDWDLHQPQSWNIYAYVRNNPINRIDSTGRSCADPNFVGPCRPMAEATLAPPRNAGTWTAEQKAAENAKNAYRAQLAEAGQLIVNRNQARPSSADMAKVNGGTAPAGSHLDHKQELVLNGAPRSAQNVAPLDATVNTSNGKRVGNAVAGFANGTVITKFNYTVLNAGGLYMTVRWAFSYNTFMQNQEIAHPGYVNFGDMMLWVATGDTRASPPPCGTVGGGYC